jgi:hypothetical protein
VRARYKELGAYHLIPWWDPELIEYLEGDLVSTEDVFRKLWKHLNRSVSRDELENFRNLNRMTFLGCRIHVPTADLRVAEEKRQGRRGPHAADRAVPGIPEGPNPPWPPTWERTLSKPGCWRPGGARAHPPHPKTAKVTTAKDCVVPGDWVVTIEREQKALRRPQPGVVHPGPQGPRAAAGPASALPGQ